METEMLLEKLRRLRYQSDYSLRLFLALLGDPAGGVLAWEGANFRTGLQRQAPGVARQRRSDPCPCCGAPRTRPLRACQ